MVTPIRSRPAVASYSTAFKNFLQSAPDQVKAQCELRKVRVAFEKGMRIVRVFNWDSDFDDTLEIVNQTGCCSLYSKPAMWNNACVTPLLLPCPGDYEIRLPDNELLPPEALVQDQPVEEAACACIAPYVQVYL